MDTYAPEEQNRLTQSCDHPNSEPAEGKEVFVFQHPPEERPTSLNNPSETDEITEPPYGWVIVVSSFTIQAFVTGTINSFGTYQDLYVNDLYHTLPASQISLIGTLMLVGHDLIGPLAGSFIDRFGHRISILLGTVVMSLALLVASFSSMLWHLYLSQGLMYGFGGAMAFFAAISIPSQWFKARRGFATGIASSGGGIGGLIMSPLTVALFDKVGYPWAMRTLALIHLVVLVPVGVLIRHRLQNDREQQRQMLRDRETMAEELQQDPLHAVASHQKGGIMDFSVMREKKFAMLLLHAIVVSLGFFVPYYYFATYARLNGISIAMSSVLIGILNGGSTLGRIVVGLASDSIGGVNSLTLSAFFSSVSMFSLWMFARTLPVMVIFCIFYGFFSGAFFALLPSVCATLCGVERLASVTGIAFAASAIGSLIGIPTAGALLENGSTTNYLPLQLWTGFVMATAAAIAFILKIMMARHILAKV